MEAGGPESGLGSQPVLWLSEQPPQLRPIITDLGMITPMDPGTITGLRHMLITVVPCITGRDTIGGDRLPIGDDKGPVRSGPFHIPYFAVFGALSPPRLVHGKPNPLIADGWPLCPTV